MTILVTRNRKRVMNLLTLQGRADCFYKRSHYIIRVEVVFIFSYWYVAFVLSGSLLKTCSSDAVCRASNSNPLYLIETIRSSKMVRKKHFNTRIQIADITSVFEVANKGGFAVVIPLFALHLFLAPRSYIFFLAIHLLTHTCLCTILHQATPLTYLSLGNVTLAGSTLAQAPHTLYSRILVDMPHLMRLNLM